jgi:hypothetical protein
MATRKRVSKKPVKRKRTTKETPLTKIAANEVYKACRRAGMDEGTSLAFAMDRSSYPDWIVPADDPIKKIGWEDGEEDN